MSTNRTCNSSFWTKEEDKIFEDTLAIYFNDGNLLAKMEEALPGKSRDDIIDHYNILVEDVNAVESGRVPLPNYPKMQSDSNQKSRFSNADVKYRRWAVWTEEEHRSFLWGLDEYGKGEWKSISMHCVITRTATQVASHAQKYFKRLEAIKKGNRRASILDITSVDVEAAGTFQVPNTKNMIRPAFGGSQAVPSTNNEGILPRGSTNAEQMIEVAGGESSGHNAAFVNGMNSLYPDVNAEFILDIDIMEQEDANEAGFLVDAGRSVLPSKQPCTAASSGTYSHPITRIGSELEALITEHKDEDNDLSSIFDVGKAPTSHALLSNTFHSGFSSYTIASFDAKNAPENAVAAHSGMSSYAAASFAAKNAPDNMVADRSGMTSFAVASIGAKNAPQNRVAAPAQLPPIAPSSNTGVGVCPNLNTPIYHEGIFDLHDMFTDQMF